MSRSHFFRTCLFKEASGTASRYLRGKKISHKGTKTQSDTKKLREPSWLRGFVAKKSATKARRHKVTQRNFVTSCLCGKKISHKGTKTQSDTKKLREPSWLRVFVAKKTATKARRHKVTQRSFVNLRDFVAKKSDTKARRHKVTQRNFANLRVFVAKKSATKARRHKETS
ncbi:hypothetical protein [Desulfonema magnum]|uniref:hypothetical protein n=1 Tax=Desulfonema magnum TaxID=45655 RepID=UPI001A9BB449|nr:hypothetical protein [Desulfonema magnum]